jgi:DNA-binding NarL/FixJ family response regulator
MDSFNVAIVDDHSLFRSGIASLIKHFKGLNLSIEASNGKEFLDQIKVSKKVPDVVLMDIQMPEMDGLETTQYLRLHHPTIKVIMLSMFSSSGSITQAVENGASGYLLKNAEPEELKIAIFDVLASGFYFNENVSKAMIAGFVSKNQISPKLTYTNELSEREKQVLLLVCDEQTNKEIADKLNLSLRTIEGHRKRIIDKIGCKSIIGAVMYAIRENIAQASDFK